MAVACLYQSAHVLPNQASTVIVSLYIARFTSVCLSLSFIARPQIVCVLNKRGPPMKGMVGRRRVSFDDYALTCYMSLGGVDLVI